MSNPARIAHYKTRCENSNFAAHLCEIWRNSVNFFSVCHSVWQRSLGTKFNAYKYINNQVINYFFGNSRFYDVGHFDFSV